jgi:hypothetical protein
MKLTNEAVLEILRSILKYNWTVYRRVPLTGKAKAHMRLAIRRDAGTVRFFESLTVKP